MIKKEQISELQKKKRTQERLNKDKEKGGEETKLMKRRKKEKEVEGNHKLRR